MNRNDIINRLPMVAFDLVHLEPLPADDEEPRRVQCRFRALCIVNSTLIEASSSIFEAWALPGEDEATVPARTWSLMAEEALEDLHDMIPPHLNLRDNIEQLLEKGRTA